MVDTSPGEQSSTNRNTALGSGSKPGAKAGSGSTKNEKLLKVYASQILELENSNKEKQE